MLSQGYLISILHNNQTTSSWSQAKAMHPTKQTHLQQVARDEPGSPYPALLYRARLHRSEQPNSPYMNWIVSCLALFQYYLHEQVLDTVHHQKPVHYFFPSDITGQ
uniref:Uncharacterized protein n=1 Tax=Arundo donax TaxID=35708 RepID=A0A0A9DJK9_ARUDO